MPKSWLAHPLTRGLDIDDPRTTQLRRQILRENRFLQRVYRGWYASIAVALPSGQGAVLELGSGAGFLSDFIPNLITSEVFYCPGVRAVLNGMQMPFATGAARGIVMINVLHHLPQPRRFFAEAARCVQPGGAIVMIEPWVTPWSRFVYTRLHHEPFCPEALEWESPCRGPLSGANGALAWIIFERDRHQFEKEFPDLQIETITLSTPLTYLLSGGLSHRRLIPGCAFGLWHQIETAVQPWIESLAMFAQVVLQRSQTSRVRSN